MNPKMHRDMYNSENTLGLFFRRLDSRIDPKNIELMLVAVPKKRLWLPSLPLPP
jgi:hypothetical protein